MTLTADRLHELVRYDYASGSMFWLPRTEPARQAKSWNVRNAGRQVGVPVNTGYLQTSIDGKKHVVHRLVWLYVHGEFPPDQIDHINGVRTDNRIENLRVAPQIINAKNQALRSTNTSGRVGVGWYAKKSRWTAQICVSGRSINLGYFREFEDAVKARVDAEIKYGFHPNHGRQPAVRYGNYRSA